jgi:hypothetical protein
MDNGMTINAFMMMSELAASVVTELCRYRRGW